MATARFAVVHACGSGDDSRSHFEAMATMERGQPGDAKRSGHGDASGWLARHLGSAPTSGRNASPLRAVAFASTLPDALRGATQVTTLASLADFRLRLPDVEKVVSGRTDANTGVPSGAAPPGDGAASAATKHNPALRKALADLYQPGTEGAMPWRGPAGKPSLSSTPCAALIRPATVRPTARPIPKAIWARACGKSPA
jgi:hypothetical protein